jgi:hypothetical protein
MNPQIIAIVQALEALDALAESNQEQLTQAARWLLEQKPDALPKELVDRIRDCGPMLSRKVSTADAAGRPMLAVERLRWLAKVVRDSDAGVRTSSAPPPRPTRNSDSTKEFEFSQHENHEIAACRRELRAEHDASSWTAREWRLEEIRRYEHRKCRTPCTSLLGVCPARGEPHLTRPDWAYAHAESPATYAAQLARARASAKPIDPQPVAPPPMRQRAICEELEGGPQAIGDVLLGTVDDLRGVG